MKKFVLTCCSTTDMDKKYFEEKNIPFVCFHYQIDGKQYPDDLGETIPFNTFYKMIADGAMPTTSQVNSDEFIKFFEPFLKDGYDILHVALSSGLSGTFNSANIAKNELHEKYPQRTIKIIDSLGASSGSGLLVDYLADLRDNGKTIDECFDWAQENKLNVHHWFFSTDLTSFKRGGRISATAAFFGQALNICPILNVDNNGKLVARKKIRTKKKTIEELVNIMEKHAQNNADYNGKCFISHSACYDDAKNLSEQIQKRLPNLQDKIIINSIGTVIGSHTGPGTVALFFMGDKRID